MISDPLLLCVIEHFIIWWSSSVHRRRRQLKHVADNVKVVYHFRILFYFSLDPRFLQTNFWQKRGVGSLKWTLSWILHICEFGRVRRSSVRTKKFVHNRPSSDSAVHLPIKITVGIVNFSSQAYGGWPLLHLSYSMVLSSEILPTFTTHRHPVVGTSVYTCKIMNG